jgi:hypothetical protein
MAMVMTVAFDRVFRVFTFTCSLVDASTTLFRQLFVSLLRSGYRERLASVFWMRSGGHWS